jgi:hypothetical protein
MSCERVAHCRFPLAEREGYTEAKEKARRRVTPGPLSSGLEEASHSEAVRDLQPQRIRLGGGLALIALNGMNTSHDSPHVRGSDISRTSNSGERFTRKRN